MLGLEIGAVIFLAVGVILSSEFADKVGATPMLIWGFAGCLVSGLLMGPMLGAASLWIVFAWLAFSLFAMGFTYGPLGGWLPSLFPSNVRYTGVSITFNLGGIVGGALAPIVAQALAMRGGLALVGMYLVAAGILSLGGVMLVRGPPAKG